MDRIQQLEAEIELQAEELRELARFREENRTLSFELKTARYLLNARFSEAAPLTVQKARMLIPAVDLALSKPAPTEDSGKSCRIALVRCRVFLKSVYEKES